jgi:hypothetical protein
MALICSSKAEVIRFRRGSGKALLPLHEITTTEMSSIFGADTKDLIFSGDKLQIKKGVRSSLPYDEKNKLCPKETV